VPARACENRTSDHWPFEKAGETVARIGGNPSPGYHSARDLPRQVSRRQLARTGAVVWEWLRG
jgi:Peptidase family M28